MICEKCGNTNPDGAAFCRFCGNRLVNDAQDNGPAAANSDQNISAAHARLMNMQNQNAGGYTDPRAGADPYRNAGGYTDPRAGADPYRNAGGYTDPRAGADPYRNAGPAPGPFGRERHGGPNAGAYVSPGASRTVSKWLIAVIAEAAALLVVLVIAITLFSQAGSVDRKAEKYFVALVNGNYKKAFSSLNLKKDKFVNPDGFELAMSGQDFSEVDNYSIRDYDGLFDDYYGLEYKESDLGRTYVAFYRNKGASYDSQYYIQMVKSGKGGKWYVSSDSLIVKNVKIRVPLGAQVTVDGIEVPEKYASDDGEDVVDGVTCYTFPQLFSGAHYISVNVEGFKELRYEWYVYGNEETCSLLDLQCTPETIEMLQSQAAANMKRIYQAVLNDQSFDTIADLFSKNPEYLESIRQEYEDLVEDMHGDDYWVSSMSFKDITAESSTDYPDVNLSFSCTGTWHEKGYSGDISEGSGDTTSDTYFNFMLENGSWVQTSLACYRIYF